MGPPRGMDWYCLIGLFYNENAQNTGLHQTGLVSGTDALRQTCRFQCKNVLKPGSHFQLLVSDYTHVEP